MKFALICLSIFGIIISLSVYSFRMTSKPVNNPIVIDGGKSDRLIAKRKAEAYQQEQVSEVTQRKRTKIIVI